MMQSSCPAVLGVTVQSGGPERDQKEGIMQCFQDVVIPWCDLFQGQRPRDATGTTLLVSFAEATDAVRCAIALKRDLQAWNTARLAHDKVVYRFGIDNEASGAGQLATLAPPGDIYITETVCTNLQHHLELTYTHAGSYALQSSGAPVPVFRVHCGTLLIVDDDVEWHGNISPSLTREGFSVVHACGYAEALQPLGDARSLQPMVALVDLHFPSGQALAEGYNVLTALRTNEVYAIVVSGWLGTAALDPKDHPEILQRVKKEAFASPNFSDYFISFIHEAFAHVEASRQAAGLLPAQQALLESLFPLT
jgi:CheY-like chemotaxis protein